MKKFRRVGSLLAALAILASFAAARALPVSNRNLSFKSKAVTIAITYPQTGNRAIDTTLADFARRNFDDEKNGQSPDSSDTVQTKYTITYRIMRNDDDAFAVLFNASLDQGGLHPDWAVETFNFTVPDGAQVFLANLVPRTRGTARLSELAMAGLRKQFDDTEWIDRGAAPERSNFTAFVLRPQAIEIVFQPYQAAPHSAGAPHLAIPFASLKGYLRADWRTQPSFACSGTRSAVESAICADPETVRLDRQVTGLYETMRDSGLGEEAVGRLQASQRDWLALRNRSCAGAEPAACLRTTYANRLAILRKGPT